MKRDLGWLAEEYQKRPGDPYLMRQMWLRTKEIEWQLEAIRKANQNDSEDIHWDC
jgi:hypothetical protein